jgi:hypothetical protein
MMKTHTNVGGFSIRTSLAKSIEKAWARLAKPGTWWTGEERLAIARETRNAMACSLCHARKNALSPNHAQGEHDSLGCLSNPAIEAIHRIRTDAGRLTEHWCVDLQAQGLKDAEYVEIIGIVATVSAIDTFDRAMGFQERLLPISVDGQPSRHRPVGAKPGMGWLETLTPEDLRPDDPDPFIRFGASNVNRALTLVPEEAIAFFDLDIELYFVDREFTKQRAMQLASRALTEEQIELVAARTASLNGCYY